ncbi:hypothetical protein C7449_1129 [Mycoplana dimorpha]|uniref:Helix-turn-helix protein n=1 Tax=Mycoplana dimorpha TaxID=28320 RepID=A0A2T5ANR5_MYCDI|nr:hypothetical protein C7449_1129 [Mycoplana dimorpha]
MNRKQEFRRLKKNLALSLEETAALTGKSFATVAAYASEMNVRIPPLAVIDQLNAERLRRSIETVRAAGYDVRPASELSMHA